MGQLQPVGMVCCCCCLKKISKRSPGLGWMVQLSLQTLIFFSASNPGTRGPDSRGRGMPRAEALEAVFALLQERASRCAWGPMSP